MVWLRFGFGSFGMVCLGAAAILLLERSDAFDGIPLGTVLTAIAVVGLGLGLTAMIRATPVQTERTAVEDAPDSPTVTHMTQTTRTRLVPMLPNSSDKACKSWLGGAPMLPKGAEWPVIAGQPAQFLAQIDCAALPGELWKGVGPRFGSMAFFRAATHVAGELPVRVLHVEGPLTSCSAPEGQARRPRWPLLVQTADQPDAIEDDHGGVEPDWGVLHDVDLTSPGYQPFDWTSAAMLLGCMKTLVASYAEELGTTGNNEENTHLQQVSDGLARLNETLVVAQTGQAFDEEARHTLQVGLAALSLPAGQMADDTALAHGVPLSRHCRAAQAFFTPFERHCRQIYTESPCHLPAEQRALFEPLWAHNARHETGCIGAADLPLSLDTGRAELLLELPSSELLGWMFGEGRALRIYVASDDLEKGVLDGAWGSVAA